MNVSNGHATFDEIAETLRFGLRRLHNLPDRTIVLGPHQLLGAQGHPFQPDNQLILYNFEQRESPALNNSSLHFFRHHEVWDYSPSNVDWLHKHGVKAKHVPLGYVPELRRIEKTKPDIDVLFYGLVNDRRRRILDNLRAAGLKVHETASCYGQERDALIGRSKLVLNMHYYETRIFEIVRCSYLFANSICVVSEESVDVPDFACAGTFVRYEKLVDACVALASNSDEIRMRANCTHEAFRSCDETSILRTALDESRP